MKSKQWIVINLLVVVGLTAVPSFGQFPEPGLMKMRSQIQLHLFLDGRFIEDVIFDSELEVEIREAFVNRDGFRQLEFVAIGWRGEGFSTFAGRQISFHLSPDISQPISTVVSTTTTSDFPAEITFNSTYDATIEDLTTIENLPGMATGTVTSLPPGEAGLAVQKFLAFQDGEADFEFRGGQCAYSPASTCQSAEGIFGDGFEAGDTSSWSGTAGSP